MSLTDEIMESVAKSGEVDPNEIEREKIGVVKEFLSIDNVEFLTDTPHKELLFWTHLENFAKDPLPIYNTKRTDKITIPSLISFIEIYKMRQVSKSRSRSKELLESIKAMFKGSEPIIMESDQHKRIPFM